MVVYMYLWLYSTDTNMQRYVDTCKWLTWITLDMRQGEDRRQVGTKRKIRWSKYVKGSYVAQTIPWHLLKGVLPEHIK